MLREVADEGRTVFLSSHTLSEVERVADRVGIIRHGHLVVVESIDQLKKKAIRRLDLEFAGPVDAAVFEGLQGVHSVAGDTTRVSVSYEGPMGDLIQTAMPHNLVNVETVEADLEEIFLTYYRNSEEVTA